MRLTRLLSLATALGLAAMLTVPTGALAHEVVETTVRFNGNYLMVDVGTTGDPSGEVRLDVYDGKIGRSKRATLVTAGVYSFTWEPIRESNTCRVDRIEWIGQNRESPAEPYVTDVTFTSQYAGTLNVALELHGRHLTYEGVPTSDGAWCDYQLEPTSVADLGEVDFTAAATWDSVVEGKGRRTRVRTSVAFEAVTFDGVALSLGDEYTACSMARRMPIPVYEFVG